MQAVILAGGRGTRLAEYTSELPKSMLKIGDKPMIQHQVELLKKYGINDIIILVNYLKDSIIKYLGDGKEYGVDISYYEEKDPLGTVGGIKEIEERLKDNFLVLYGDVMINMDLSRLIAFHAERDSECTLVLHPNSHPFDSDLVETDVSGRIIAFHPKPHPQGLVYRNLVNAGVYLFNTTLLTYLEKGRKADFGRQVFPAIYEDIRMFGYHTAEYLKDMGTPDRLQQVDRDWHSGRIGRASYENRKKAIFLDRDGVINIEKNFISRPEDLELYAYTPEALKRINESDYLSIVVTNQSAIARNLCTVEELGTIHKKLETDLGDKGTWLDAIYYCPHHPDKGFPEENPEFKIDCDCRKPKTGMFLKAVEEFNIDLSGSFMIGDSERDIQAGVNAGCTTIGVRSGYGIRQTKLQPDYFFEDLKEAVDFVIEEPYRNLFLDLFEKFGRSERKPFIISISGNARSGKSVLSSYLYLKFKELNCKPLKIELDNWIVPEAMRDNCRNVYDRFQLNRITSDIRQILAGETIPINSYSNHPERKSMLLSYSAEDAGVIILEGVVALSDEYLRTISDYKIFMEIPGDIFYQRFVQYYLWKGKAPDEVERLLEKRKSDEYLFIEKESKFADIVINPFKA